MYEDPRAIQRARQSKDISRERKDLEELATIAQAQLHLKVKLEHAKTEQEKELCEKELAELTAKAEELRNRWVE
jgi:hypothetical protein